MKGIPHHLFSVLDPAEPVSIAWYQKEAMKLIDEILARGGLPVLVGGSMLYIASIIDGLVPVDRSDPDLRKKLEEEYDRDEGHTQWNRLQEMDPESAENIPHENKVYVVRALEIIELTGKKKSQQRDRTTPPYDIFIIGIDQDREVLKKRIIERTKKMFEQGWMDEVKSLMERGYDETTPAMQSHGYREIMEAIQSGSIDHDALIDVISKNSIAYAKRQRTWWKGDERIRWVVFSRSGEPGLAARSDS
jgi:tRNA dimethylallyltransferase